MNFDQFDFKPEGKLVPGPGSDGPDHHLSRTPREERARYEVMPSSMFNIRMRNAFGRIVADNIGANMQTGFWCGERFEDRLQVDDEDLEHCPYISVQVGPNHRVVFYVVDENGEVHER